jgi:hypothetical protein
VFLSALKTVLLCCLFRLPPTKRRSSGLAKNKKGKLTSLRLPRPRPRSSRPSHITEPHIPEANVEETKAVATPSSSHGHGAVKLKIPRKRLQIVTDINDVANGKTNDVSNDADVAEEMLPVEYVLTDCETGSRQGWI